jgi:hypothetical protein
MLERRFVMPDDAKALLRPDDAAGRAARPDREDWHEDRPARPRHMVKNEAPPVSRKWPRRGMFALLPIALAFGAYWYVTGGAVMSTDDAYIEADKVGVSTDVSGIVKEVAVTENQHVDTGQVLYRLDDLPFPSSTHSDYLRAAIALHHGSCRVSAAGLRL